AMKKNANTGSSFESFLEENDIQDVVDDAAVKKLFALAIRGRMKERNLTQRSVAAAMHTSPAALRRIMDPSNRATTLTSLTKAANAVGCRVELKLINCD